MKKFLFGVLFLLVVVSSVFPYGKEQWERYLNNNRNLLSDACKDNEPIVVTQVKESGSMPCFENGISGRKYRALVYYKCKQFASGARIDTAQQLYYNDDGDVATDSDYVSCVPRKN